MRQPLHTTRRCLALGACLAFTTQLPAQRVPSIGYVYPAGAAPGASVQVKLSGQYLDGLTHAYVSGTGVHATVLEHVKPLNGKEINLLRDRLKELQEALKPKKGREQAKSPDNPAPPSKGPPPNLDRASAQKEIDDIKKKLANPKNRNRENPQLAEDVTLQIVLAPDAEPGKRELRLRTALGLSNPLAFRVGQLPEYIEKEPNNKMGDAEKLPPLPVVVNGQILPGDVDRFRFQARQGEQLVLATSARMLIPYLADAVPGWFQASLALYDAQGNELAYADDYRFHPDPVLHYDIPADGDYVIEIKDALYRGREDFVYRISVGELPFITSVFPLGGPAGTQTALALKGWNLPTDTLLLDTQDTPKGIIPLAVHMEDRVSNQVPFAVDTLPECLEQEPNQEPAQAQPLQPGLIVNGRIDSPGDCDVFSFPGRQHEEIVAEIHARRLDSPLDSVLTLTDAEGRQIAFNDDHEDKGAGLETHHADSWLHATLPGDGTYYLHLADAQHKGGPEFAYRLRLGPPQPDFQLRIVPSSINARRGARVPLTLYALRKDGFSGEIALALRGAPKGFTLSGGRLPADQDQVRLTLTVPSTPMDDPLSLSLEGRATIQGQVVVRPAVPAEDMMQAFFYRHLVPAQDLQVAVIQRGGTGTPRKAATQKKNRP